MLTWRIQSMGTIQLFPLQYSFKYPASPHPFGVSDTYRIAGRADSKTAAEAGLIRTSCDMAEAIT
jgi:hypothetical protein